MQEIPSIDYSGWLYKTSSEGLISSTKHRFFHVTTKKNPNQDFPLGVVAYYYRNESDANPLGVIDFQHVISVEEDADDVVKVTSPSGSKVELAAMHLITRQRIWRLRATSTDEHEHWLNIFRKALLEAESMRESARSRSSSSTSTTTAHKEAATHTEAGDVDATSDNSPLAPGVLVMASLQAGLESVTQYIDMNMLELEQSMGRGNLHDMDQFLSAYA